MLKEEERKRYIFWISVTVIHVIYFVVAVINKHIYMADSYEYLQQAFNIRNFGSFYCLDFNQPIEMHFFTKRPPLYGLLIMVIKVIYNSDFLVLFVQNVLSMLNIIGLMKILDKQNFNFDFRKLVLVFLICLPAQFIYANMIMSEMLLQTLLFWSFYFFLLFTEEGKTRHIILCNILLALAVLTKPVLVYFWIPNLLLLIYLSIKMKRPRIVFAGALMPVVIFALSLYNYYTTGSFHYSSIKHVSLTGYNSAFLNIKVYGEEEGTRRNLEVRAHLDSIKSFPEVIKEEERIGYGIILEHKYEYMKFHLSGMINFLMDPGRFDIYNFLGIKEDNNTGLLYTFTKEGYSGVLRFILRQPVHIILYILLVMIANILLLISLIHFIFVKSIRVEVRIFLFVLIFYMCLFSGPLGTMRYKLHVIPVMLFTIPFFFGYIRMKFFRKDKGSEEKKTEK